MKEEEAKRLRRELPEVREEQYKEVSKKVVAHLSSTVFANLPFGIKLKSIEPFGDAFWGVAGVVFSFPTAGRIRIGVYKQHGVSGDLPTEAWAYIPTLIALCKEHLFDK